MPAWLEASLELESDIAAAPDRTLAIDQAAQRRSVLPDVVRRQLQCLAYVRRHISTTDVRASMSVVELLIGVERLDPRHASLLRHRALRGEIKVADLRADLTRVRSRVPADGPSGPSAAAVLHRFQRDLPALQRVKILERSAGTTDPSWVGADYAGIDETKPEGRIWAWAGIVSPHVGWSVLRAAPASEFIRCILAASLWGDMVSIATRSSEEAALIRECLARAPQHDRRRFCLHDLRAESGVDRMAHDKA